MRVAMLTVGEVGFAGAGVIGDISESWDRGSKFGVFNLGPMLAPNIGPVIGGVLAENLGWRYVLRSCLSGRTVLFFVWLTPRLSHPRRSVFWFLTIGSAVCFIFILCLLPETLRALVGNGSIQQRPLLRPFFPILGRGRRSPTIRDSSTPRPTPPFPNPFLLFQYPDLCLVLAFTGVVYAVNYSITATISSSFQELYPYLSETDTGLVYLSTGGGMIVGSTVTGRLLDWDFGRVKRRFAEEKERRGETVEGDLARDLSFPIEEARLRMMPAHLVVFIASTIGWGWSLTSGTSIAVPLVLQIIRKPLSPDSPSPSTLTPLIPPPFSLTVGWTSMAILNTSMTLGLDLLPKQSSSVTACVNLVRCSLAAILVSVIDKATSRLGFGVTYTILSAVCVLLLPLMYLEMRVGERFRRKRAARHVE